MWCEDNFGQSIIFVTYDHEFVDLKKCNNSQHSLMFCLQFVSKNVCMIVIPNSIFFSIFIEIYVKARDTHTCIPDWNKHFNYYQIFSLTLGIGSYLHSFVISEQKSNSCLLVLPCRCIHGIRGLLFFCQKSRYGYKIK